MTNYTAGSLVAKQRVIDSFSEAIVLIDTKGTLLKANNSAKKLLQIEEVNGQSIQEYLNFDHADDTPNKVLLRSEKQWFNVSVIELNKDLFFILIRGLSLDSNSSTVQKHIHTLLKVSEEGMLMYEGENIIDCDHTLASMFGYSKEELRTLQLNQLFKKEADQLYGIKKNGKTYPVEIIGKSDELTGEVIIVLVKDISVRMDYEKQIETLAYYNELTQLPNKNFFLLQLEKKLKQAKWNDKFIAVYYIDMNYFKAINETLGYDFGDKLLKACGKRLIETANKEEYFVAHVNGDEFLIMQENICEKSETHTFADKLISAFERPIIIDGHEIHTSISIGISIYPTDSTCSQELIKHANSAMHIVNEDQYNSYYHFNTSITQEFRKRLMMEDDLRQALRLNQFQLHYQPQVCLNENKVIGMEALIRWTHPEKGNIPPLDFIPLAEKTGLIIEIGRWVLEEACRQSVRWQEEGYDPIQISVNLSAKQLLQKDFISCLKEVLDETKVNPTYLELEITESVAMTSEETILKIVNQIRMLGVSVAIDDFGTGYSSLKYLSLYPINKLKIDKMFIQSEQTQNKMIVKSIIHLSHALNMQVIAEGVETESQKQLLEELNCDQMQGFYFSRPLPAEKVVNFLQKRRQHTKRC